MRYRTSRPYDSTRHCPKCGGAMVDFIVATECQQCGFKENVIKRLIPMSEWLEMQKSN